MKHLGILAGPAGNLMIFDIWENQEMFGEFGKVLMPVPGKHGLDAKAPEVMPVRNMIF